MHRVQGYGGLCTPIQPGGTLTYEIEYRDGLATVRVFPDAGTAECMQALNEVINAPWRGELLCLLILDEGSAISPTRDELGDIKKLMDTVLSGPDVKIAVVVTKIVHFGIGRVFEARLSGAGRMRVFMNEQAAREWLGSCAL